ncbi:hypothetical protein Tco_0677837 [Tanacetum coccineum]|uniref:Separase-like second TPR repeats region domain-containing protein n=1 Tax=Tanacetum coccineum TaxID=301880 RepID=A0ABQ4XE95_9ASTR
MEVSHIAQNVKWEGKYVKSGCTTALNVVPWETNGESVLREAYYCANECRNATVDLCGAVATHLNKLANVFSEVKVSAIELIMRLYAISLSDSDLNSYSRRGSPKMAKCVEDKLLCKMEDRLTTVNGHLFSNDDNGMPMAEGLYVFLFHCIKVFVQAYIQAVDFRAQRYTLSASNKDGHVCNSGTVLYVAIAAFTPSFATKIKTEACTQFISDLVSTPCLQTKGLQYIHASLQNVGLVLRKSDGLREVLHQ